MPILLMKKTRDEIRLNTTLNALAERYRISIDEEHSSFGDALVTAQIFQNMIKQVQQDGLLRLKDLLHIAWTPLRPEAHHTGISGA